MRHRLPPERFVQGRGRVPIYSAGHFGRDLQSISIYADFLPVATRDSEFVFRPAATLKA
jgi:hypothetical protein